MNRLLSHVSLVAALIFGEVATLPGSIVQAQSDGDFVEPPSYRTAVDDAVAEYERQHFAEARALFARANAIFPNARALRGLGMVEFELRNYGMSIEYLEAALASKTRPLEGGLRTQAEELLERARGFVGYVAMNVTPGASRVIVDGVGVEVAPGKALVLQVGDHTLEFQAKGYSTERRTVSLRGGEVQTLQITLQQPLLRTAPQDTKKHDKSQIAIWSLIGGGAAVAIAGGALAGVGMKKKSNVEDAPQGDSWASHESDKKTANLFTGVGFATMGVGLASIGAGVTWKLLTRSRERSTPVQVSTYGTGLVVSGSF